MPLLIMSAHRANIDSNAMGADAVERLHNMMRDWEACGYKPEVVFGCYGGVPELSVQIECDSMPTCLALLALRYEQDCVFWVKYGKVKIYHLNTGSTLVANSSIVCVTHKADYTYLPKVNKFMVTD